MKYNVNKLRSWGLRYLVCDPDGQIWAMERAVRGEHSWRFPDEWFNPVPPPQWPEDAIRWPKNGGPLQFDEALIEQYKDRCRKYKMIIRSTEHEMRVPISDCPFNITWEDEPFDLVANGIVPESDMKQWPDP